MSTAVICLAAGQGTRMNSDLPKVLHRIAGAPLLAHALAAARAIEPERIVVVTGHEAEAVAAAAREIDENIRIAHQPEQLGTAHAVLQAAPALEGFAGDAVVLYGDTPFIRPETLDAMLEARRAGAAVVVLGFEAAVPGGYGRLVTSADGALLEIVEAKDATPEQRAITLCNSGVISADCTLLLDLLRGVGNDNAKGEYYLTDVVTLARARGLTAAAITCPEAETLGINSRADLAAAEAAFQARARAEAMENGVTLTDPPASGSPSTPMSAATRSSARASFSDPASPSRPAPRSTPSAISKAATSAAAPRSAPSPACAPARNSPRTCASATSSRSRTPSSTRAPRSTT
jgi:bifunctional UDP-N-acetylglucosamine pyrophosphorylase / glucosamine-1-phosphate N-acetyltransferase